MKRIPLESRLARAGRRSDLRTLQDYAAPNAPSAWMPANDNEFGSTQVDRIGEIRPSPDEVVRIAQKDAIRERGGYGPITPRELDDAARRNIRVEGGRIVKWKGTDNRWHDAAELFRQSKGGRRKTDEERQADNERHLSIHGSGGFPVASTYRERGSEGEDYSRQRAARWAQSIAVANDDARVDIDRAGLGGRHTFDQARSNASLPLAERCPTGIAPALSLWGTASTATRGQHLAVSWALRMRLRTRSRAQWTHRW